MSAAPTFTCKHCGTAFSVPATTMKRFPGWKPTQCQSCRIGKSRTAHTPADIVASISAGPETGVFTDGSCEGNPGPGGWGVVRVVDGEIVVERSGHEPWTTNNQMELTALIEAYKLLEPGESVLVYSDSSYAVNIINEWAARWQANGWRRGQRREIVENLDLVKELYELSKARPLATATWIRGHNGDKWNEYADALARSYQLPTPISETASTGTDGPVTDGALALDSDA